MLATRLSDQKHFGDIVPVDEAIRATAYQRLDMLTKPQGALGRLEPLAAQVCAIQRTLDIRIVEPLGLVFAADRATRLPPSMR